MLSGSSHPISDGDPYGNRMVRHTVRSHTDQGTVVSIVNESLTFKNKQFLDALDYYEFGKDDRVNIFIPKHENMRCQIAFNRFLLMWREGDEPVKARFQIYSGQGTSGELLWESKDATDAETGPGQVLTSTSSDGALTIVFNSDAKNFAQTQKGFEAVVREYDEAAPVVVAQERTANLGSEVTLSASITSGTKPYTVEWMNGKHQTLKTETTSEGTVSLQHTPTECDDYLVKVTDASGKTSIDTCRVLVRGKAVAATFENLYLDSESYNDGETLPNSFVSGTYLFKNTCQPEWNYWYGFAYSNRTSTLFESIKPDQFNAAAGSGFGNSENYVVCYPQDLGIEVLNKTYGDSIRGFYVTNNAWVVDAILNGDGYTGEGFHKGDYLRLTVKGTDAYGTENSLDFFLADYRAEKEEDRYYLDTWQWVDLRALGEVSEITFTMGSTRGNLYGMTTPQYFCMDNFNGERIITDIHKDNIGGTIDLSECFTFDHPTATVSYTIDGDNPLGLSIDGNGVLNANGQTDFTVVIKATQRGQQQFIRLIAGNATGINELETDATGINAIYDLGGKRLEKPQRGINIIRMKDGSTRKIIFK